MRVLAVTSEWSTPAYPPGGAFIARQIDGLRRRGIEIDVEPFTGARDPRRYLAVRRRVRERLRDSRYDVVHAHCGQAAVAAAGMSRPYVVTFYGSDLEGIVGRGGRYAVRGKVLRRLARRVARRADAVIVVARSLARHLPDDVSPTVIPTAVDLDVFRPGPRDAAREALDLPTDRSLVLFAGRPEMPVKRYGLARRVVELAGDGAQLLTIAGLEPSGVACYMQACDALLLTSMHEGAPTVVKEAVACRLPVVSVDVGDVRETVGDNAVVTPDDEPGTIAEALRRVLAEPRRLDAPIPDALDQNVQSARVAAIYEDVVRRNAS